MLAFDFGTRRIGVAVGQDVTGTAEALTSIRVNGGRPDWNGLSRLIAQWAPARLVLGKPMSAGSEPHALAAQVERFARRLEGRFGLPVSIIDERLSSWAAERDPDAERTGVDAVAARVILESWFAEQRRRET